MKYLSLFTGIGGFELGIKQAYEENRIQWNRSSRPKHRGGSQNLQSKGKVSTIKNTPIACIGYSEIDKYAVQIYEKHFKHKNYGDITKINVQKLPDFDLIVGGFPCQSFSIAGKRGGFEDTRGTLFFEIARIIKAKRPRYLLLENVKGLLSHDEGNTFATIISTIDELGYDCQWQVLNSKNFGVPQNRERVFIIGHLRGTPRPKVFPIGETTKKIIKTKKLSEPISNCLRTNYSNGHSNETYIKQLNKPKHSNNRIYSDKGLSPTLNTAQGGNRQPFVKIKEATKKGYDKASIGDSINFSVPNSKTRRGRVGKGIANTLDTACNQGTLKDSKIRRLTPIECERLQGFPDNWTDGVSDTQRYKTLGNAVTVNVIREIVKRLVIPFTR